MKEAPDTQQQKTNTKKTTLKAGNSHYTYQCVSCMIGYHQFDFRFDLFFSISFSFGNIF